MEKWVILFVDMVGSTDLKYRYAGYDDTVAQMIERLCAAINEGRNRAHATEYINSKFTGDGEMLVFRRDMSNGCGAALSVAENILLAVERDNLVNLKLDLPPIRIRMGIATGDAKNISGLIATDLVGRPVDLAARLCAETDPDSILIDKTTRDCANGDGYRFPDHRFVRCDRRLSLKGVPYSSPTQEDFYFFRVNRLLTSTSIDTFQQGLLDIYTDRSKLDHNWSPVRVIHRAAPDSTILVAGRTLKSWTQYRSEMRCAARENKVRFQFLLSSKQACKFLLGDQQTAIEEDLPKAIKFFKFLAETGRTHFEARISDHLILDGITCATIRPPRIESESKFDKRIVIQDINAGNADNKSSQLWGCTCPEQTELPKCRVHGLYRRTEHLFSMAKDVTIL